jgi:hypothetical protein
MKPKHIPKPVGLTVVKASHVDLGQALRLATALKLSFDEFMTVLFEVATDPEAAKRRGPFALGALSVAEVALNKAESQGKQGDGSFLVKLLTSAPEEDMFAAMEAMASEATIEIMAAEKLPSFAAVFDIAATTNTASILKFLDSEKPSLHRLPSLITLAQVDLL